MPSLDGYIQDRLNNPVHVPGHGTIKALRLEAPPPDLVRRVVEAPLRPALEELPDFANLPPIFPFTEEQIERIARTEPTLRDMLQQFRHLFDHVVFGNATPSLDRSTRAGQIRRDQRSGLPPVEMTPMHQIGHHRRRDARAERRTNRWQLDARSRGRVERRSSASAGDSAELWEQELRAARRNLEPEGSLTGATRELQAGPRHIPASLPRARRQGRVRGGCSTSSAN